MGTSLFSHCHAQAPRLLRLRQRRRVRPALQQAPSRVTVPPRATLVFAGLAFAPSCRRARLVTASVIMGTTTVRVAERLILMLLCLAVAASASGPIYQSAKTTFTFVGADYTGMQCDSLFCTEYHPSGRSAAINQPFLPRRTRPQHPHPSSAILLLRPGHFPAVLRPNLCRLPEPCRLAQIRAAHHL